MFLQIILFPLFRNKSIITNSFYKSHLRIYQFSNKMSYVESQINANIVTMADILNYHENNCLLLEVFNLRSLCEKILPMTLISKESYCLWEVKDRTDYWRLE